MYLSFGAREGLSLTKFRSSCVFTRHIKRVRTGLGPSLAFVQNEVSRRDRSHVPKRCHCAVHGWDSTGARRGYDASPVKRSPTAGTSLDLIDTQAKASSTTIGSVHIQPPAAAATRLPERKFLLVVVDLSASVVAQYHCQSPSSGTLYCVFWPETEPRQSTRAGLRDSIGSTILDEP